MSAFYQLRNIARIMSYPMNPYALHTCTVGASCHVLTDFKLNIVEFSVFVIQFPGTLQTTIPGTLQTGDEDEDLRCQR